jgi:hypothetical protein
MRVFAVLLLFIFTAESSAQTLADIARKERARQKQAQSQNRGTFTNPTPGSATGSLSSKPIQSAPLPAPAAAPPRPAGPVDNKGRDEKYWREAFEKARDLVKRADEKVQIQEATLRDLNTQLLRQSDIYNRENVIGAKITAAQKDLDAAKREAEQARTKITELEQELRSAGGLPGWAR